MPTEMKTTLLCIAAALVLGVAWIVGCTLAFGLPSADDAALLLGVWVTLALLLLREELAAVERLRYRQLQADLTWGVGLCRWHLRKLRARFARVKVVRP